LHRQLLYKMQIYGVNSIFGLKFNITIGESMLIATAVGTGLFLYALPVPSPLKISRTLPISDKNTEDVKLYELQQNIVQTCQKNLNNIEQLIQEYKVLQHPENIKTMDLNASQFVLEEPIEENKILDNNNEDNSSSSSSSDTDSDFESDRIQSKITVQVVDDIDEELLMLLLQDESNEDFQMMTIESFPGKTNKFWDLIYDSIQYFSIIKQIFINPVNSLNAQFSNLLKDLHKEIEFRLSYIQPCLVTGLDYDVQIIENFEVQVHISGVAICYCRNNSERLFLQDDFLNSSEGEDDDESDLIFPIESIDDSKAKSPKESIVESPLRSPVVKSTVINHPQQFFKSGSSSSDKDYSNRHYFSLRKKRKSLKKSFSNSENENDLPYSHSWLFNNSYPKVALNNNNNNNNNKSMNLDSSIHASENNTTTDSNTNKNDDDISEVNKIIRKSSEDSKSVNISTSLSKMKLESESKSIRTVSTFNRKVKDISNNNLITDANSKISKEINENESIFKSIKMNTSYYAEITPLSTLPGATIMRYLGKLSLHFVKDAHMSESNINDLGGFTHRLLMEVNSISRAHAIALGGNCILAYRFDKNVIEEGMKKYALISVSGKIK